MTEELAGNEAGVPSSPAAEHDLDARLAKLVSAGEGRQAVADAMKAFRVAQALVPAPAPTNLGEVRYATGANA